MSSIHNPSTGTAPPATYGDQINDNDEYLHLRGPYICTSATRPGSPFEGQRIYETDTDFEYTYSGAAWINTTQIGAWTTYTPSMSTTIGNGVLSGRWRRQGTLVHFYIKLVWGSTTSHAASIQTFTLPVPAAAHYTALIGFIGSLAMLDSGTATFSGAAYKDGASTSTIRLVTGGSTGTGDAAVTNTAPFTFTTNDEVHISGAYEALNPS